MGFHRRKESQSEHDKISMIEQEYYAGQRKENRKDDYSYYIFIFLPNFIFLIPKPTILN